MISSGVELLYFFNLITKEVNAEGVIIIPWEDVQHIAFDAEIAVPKVSSSAGIEALHKAVHQLSAWQYIAPLDSDNVLLKFHRVTDTIQTRH